uniref:WAP domain-containing protein n=1 Tax=Sphenodon punctatus TaxID=8508 RepID=A0A8D0HNW0_SPHPU
MASRAPLLLLVGLLILWAELPALSAQDGQGKCPAPPADSKGLCSQFCSTDRDCPGSERCCSNGCGRECIRTIFVFRLNTRPTLCLMITRGVLGGTTWGTKRQGLRAEIG